MECNSAVAGCGGMAGATKMVASVNSPERPMFFCDKCAEDMKKRAKQTGVTLIIKDMYPKKED